MRFVLSFFISSLLVINVYSENRGTDARPALSPGLEIKKIGDVNVVVPKGGEVRREGGVVTIESTAEYAAEGFIKVNERLSKIEDEQTAIRNEMDHLKEVVDKIMKGNSISEDIR